MAETEAHEIFVGDKIQRALNILSDESDDFQLLGRAASEVDHDVELRGNYLRVEVSDDAE